MALTVAQASAVNTLLEHLTGGPSHRYDGWTAPTDDQVIEAASLLAAHASKTLMVGFDGPRATDAVRQHLARTQDGAR